MTDETETGEVVERYESKTELPRFTRIGNPGLPDGEFALIRVEGGDD